MSATSTGGGHGRMGADAAPETGGCLRVIVLTVTEPLKAPAWLVVPVLHVSRRLSANYYAWTAPSTGEHRTPGSGEPSRG
jgi:hypothetical protein